MLADRFPIRSHPATFFSNERKSHFRCETRVRRIFIASIARSNRGDFPLRTCFHHRSRNDRYRAEKSTMGRRFCFTAEETGTIFSKRFFYYVPILSHISYTILYSPSVLSSASAAISFRTTLQQIKKTLGRKK